MKSLLGVIALAVAAALGLANSTLACNEGSGQEECGGEVGTRLEEAGQHLPAVEARNETWPEEMNEGITWEEIGEAKRLLPGW